MIVIIATLAGLIGGAMLARKRGGNGMDMAQYAFALGLTCFFLSYFILIALSRLF